MLANTHTEEHGCGELSQGVHKPATFLNELLGFIGDELPRWRDRADRPREESETILTSQLCAHLNGATRRTAGWDVLQFRVEEADATMRGRKIDLVASPAGTTITIAGRRHTEFDAIVPIECKRLPTPTGKDRDEREYVVSRYSSTGGIQRFKSGHHGAAHSAAGMIGYVQTESPAHWIKHVGAWITELASSDSNWKADDIPVLESEDTALRTARLNSTHTRTGELPEIHVRHLWISMN